MHAFRNEAVDHIALSTTTMLSSPLCANHKYLQDICPRMPFCFRNLPAQPCSELDKIHLSWFKDSIVIGVVESQHKFQEIMKGRDQRYLVDKIEENKSIVKKKQIMEAVNFVLST